MTLSKKKANWLLCFDADDTLWENELFFRRAEEAFSEELRDLINPAELRHALLEMEKQNIEKYGFGIKSFLLSKIETALGLVPADQATRVVQRILSEGDTLLHHPVELLNGVIPALERIPEPCKAVIITKGDLKDQWRKIDASGIADYFDDIHVVIDKTPDTYAQIAQTHGIAPERMIMIGNAMKSDIVPVIELGGYAIFVPHAEMWIYEVAKVPHECERFFECPSLIEAMDHVDAILAKPST